MYYCFEKSLYIDLIYIGLAFIPFILLVNIAVIWRVQIMKFSIVLFVAIISNTKNLAIKDSGKAVQFTSDFR